MIEAILSTLQQFLSDASPLTVRLAHDHSFLPHRLTEPFLILDVSSLHAASPICQGNDLRYPFMADLQVTLAAPVCCHTAEMQAILSRFVLPPMLRAGFTVTDIEHQAVLDTRKPLPEVHTLNVTFRINGVYTSSVDEETAGEATA